jgi:hypothetical protein
METKIVEGDLLPATRFLFPLPSPSATSASLPFLQTEMLDGQKIKTSGVDSDRCAHLENRSEEEDSGGKHCPNVEAN